jgi:hypothetical protein
MFNDNYSTVEIADLIGSTVSKINYYIREGILLAENTKNGFSVPRKNFITFYDYYYNTDKRNSKRGVAKKLSEDKISLMIEAMLDAKDNKINITDFHIKYQVKQYDIPNFKELLLYKRNTFILLEKKDGKNPQYISEKYGIKKSSVEKIVYQHKESNF